MAKKPPVEPASEGQEFLTDDTFTGEQLSAALSSLDAEMGVESIGQVKVYVYKALPDGREARIWDGTPEDYNLMTVAKRFGSGDYHVKVYSPQQNGRYSLRARKVYPIVLDPGEDQRLDAERRGVVTQQNSAPALTAEAIAAAVAQGIKQSLPAPLPANNMEAMGQMIALVKTMLPAFQPAPVAPAVNPMEMMRSMAEMVRELKEDAPPEGGASGMDILYKLVDRMGPFLEKMIPAVAGGAPGGAGGLVMLQPPSGADRNIAAGAVQQPGNAVAVSPDKAREDAMLKLKMGLSFLCMQAAAGNDAALYAEVVIDNVPPDVLKGFCERPDFIDYLSQYDADIKLKHAAWFTQLRAEVNGMLAEEPASNAGMPDGEQPAA